MTQTWAIIGSGFNALVAADILNRKGYRVTVIDKAKTAGGVLQSIEKDGFYLDKGCHLFANRDKWSMSFFENLYPNGLRPVKNQYASVFQQKTTAGISIPDFTNLSVSEQQEILHDIVVNVNFRDRQATNLTELLTNRYGHRAASYYKGFIEKSYGVDSDDVSPQVLNELTFSIRRIKATTQEVGNQLKKLEYLDELLAVSSVDDPFRFFKKDVENFTSLNYYPKEKGLYGFCESAQRILSERGVEFRLGVEVDTIRMSPATIQVGVQGGVLQNFDRLYWAAPLETFDRFVPALNFTSVIHQVPMTLLYFFVDATSINSSVDYIHHFDAECPVFRYALPANYGNPTVNGKTYIMCELPMRTTSPLWNNEAACVKASWDEIQRLGLTSQSSYERYLYYKLPVSYRIPLKGYDQRVANAKNVVDESRVFGLSKLSLSKNAIVNFVRQELEQV